jgi:hypothetical protein
VGSEQHEVEAVDVKLEYDDVTRTQCLLDFHLFAKEIRTGTTGQ